MTTETREIKIDDLVRWSEPRRVETRNGPRMLRTAATTDDFWDAWRSDKQTLKEAGVSCSKDNRTGEWQACWWQPLPKEEQEKIVTALESSRATDAQVDVPSPDGLDYLPFQRAGIAYAQQRANVLIADEMGLGKTIQALGLINGDETIKRVLVVCPASLRLNWANEAYKWLTREFRIGVAKGSKYPTDANFVIVNYDILKRYHDALRADTWDVVIFDEAHYCKNPKAQRTKEAFGYKPYKGKGKEVAAIPARRTVMLTGTPIVNRPIELFPLVEKLDPEGLGKNFFAYAKRYTDAHHNGYGWDFTGAQRLDELQRKLRESVMVRRLKQDVLTELPAKRRQVITLPANGCSKVIKEEQAIAAKREDILAELQTAIELAKAADDPEVYQKACESLREQLRVAFTEMSKARHATAVAKTPYVVEHLRDALEAGPVICFAHHKDVVAAIKAEFPDAVTVTGDTSMEARQQAVEDFQDGKTDLFIGNIQAAGVGLTLTRSSHVIFAELDWVPGDMTQAEDRAHRIGQTQSVLVQHLVLEDSIDQQMAVALIEKQEVLDKALDSPVDVPTALTKEQASTVTITPDKLSQTAEKLTDEQVTSIHLGLRMLSGMCDGARELDGCGFNKIDSRIGKSLASQGGLTKRQAALGQKLIRKYHRQLPEELMSSIG